jgi:hypothetical protein
MLRRLSPLLLAAFLATSPLWAATDPFIGQWKLDPSRSKLSDEMKVTQIGQNRYAFDFGAGKPETIVTDGTDQPGLAGTTLSVAAEGPNWKVVRKMGARKLLTATWTLSKDGNSLTDDFTSFAHDGSSSNVIYLYKRMAPGSGFAGRWVSKSETMNSVVMLQVKPDENKGLSFAIPSDDLTISAIFDGKYHPNAGGFASSARRLSAHALEIFLKPKGKITQTRQIELSPDLRTLTMTVHKAGKDVPDIYVFERQ